MNELSVLNIERVEKLGALPDLESNCGVLRGPKLTWHSMKLGKVQRSEQKLQTPCVLSFTGLSGADKSTLADVIEQKLYIKGRHTYLLDGDNVRHGLDKDLGFADQDRV